MKQSARNAGPGSGGGGNGGGNNGGDGFKAWFTILSLFVFRWIIPVQPSPKHPKSVLGAPANSGGLCVLECIIGVGEPWKHFGCLTTAGIDSETGLSPRTLTAINQHFPQNLFWKCRSCGKKSYIGRQSLIRSKDSRGCVDKNCNSYRGGEYSKGFYRNLTANGITPESLKLV